MDTVQQWMSQPAITVSETMVLPAVREFMQEHHVRRLPVVDAAGRLVGIVTEGDINRVSDSHVTDVRDYNLYHRITDLPIGEIMTRDVISIAPDAPVREVARLLLEHRIGGVPVVATGQIVGMITEVDVFRMVVGVHD